LSYLLSMARKAQPVTLSSNEIRSLKNILTRGMTSARTLSRARILDLLHRHRQPADVAALLEVSPQTAYNVKRRFLVGGLQAALFDQPRSGRPIELDGKQRVMCETSADKNRNHSPSAPLLQIYLPPTRQLRGMRPRFDGGRDFY
jgi:hypothetical protein